MRNNKVLLVDDESDLLGIYEEYLSPFKLVIDKAENGKVGFEKALKGDYGIIISDINMPFMSGLEFLRCLREQNVKSPFIFITGYGDIDKLREAWVWGAYDFLEKPLDYDLFQKTIENALNLNPAQLEEVDHREFKLEYFKVSSWVNADMHDKIIRHCQLNSISVSTFIDSILKEKL